VRPAVKVAIVAGGYLLAIFVAVAVTYVYTWISDSPERQAQSGMSAFGDSVVFLAVLGVASIPASCALILFLRGVRQFWYVTCVLALLIAASGLATAAAYAFGRAVDSPALLQSWAMWSPLRFLASLLFGPAFFLSALFAPTRAFRVALLLATAMELLALKIFLLLLFQVIRVG
jgi:hypothetical protein